MNTDIDIVLAKYFSGEASAEELRILDSWLAESEANELYFEEMTMVFENAAPTDSYQKADTARALATFEQYMQRSGSGKVAAKPKAKKRNLSKYFQVAAIFILLVATSVFLYVVSSNNANPVNIAATDSTVEHILPDNSVVVLAENSSITYSEEPASKGMVVTLVGKASFDVAPEANGKLTVYADEVIIKDIGTVFSVNAYADSPSISVEVESGIVHFYSSFDKGIELYEGELGLYDRTTKQFRKQTAGNEASLPLIFDAAPLGDVVNMLSQRFGVPVKLASPDLNNMQITVTFDESQNIDLIVRIVAETLQLNVIKDNNMYLLSK